METARVLFLINKLSVGGAERVCVDDANELLREGVSVEFCTLFGEGLLRNELLLKDENVHTLHARNVFDREALRRAEMLVKERNIAVIYSTLNEANVFGRILKTKVPAVRLVTREANMPYAKGLVYQMLDVLLAHKSDRIVAVSQSVASSIMQRIPWIKKKVTVLQNGVEVREVVLDRPSVHRLLTVGSLTEKKDQVLLIQALALLGEPYTLTMVGEGPCRKKLEGLARELGCKDRVVFTGVLSKEDVAKAYAEHDIFVLSSKREGSPNVVLEALSAGLPVVAFSIPAVAEIIENHVHGFLVSPRTAKAFADAVGHLSLSERNRLGKEGNMHVLQHYSRAQHLSALRGLLGVNKGL